MKEKYILDEYEQEIEDNFEKAKPTKNLKEELAVLKAAAKEHMKAKQNKDCL